MLAVARNNRNAVDIRVTPVIFLPGIMGSRLRLDDKTKSKPEKAKSMIDWNIDSRLDTVNDWFFESAEDKARWLNADNPGTVLDSGNGLSADRCKRGWAGVVAKYYLGTLEALESGLDSDMFKCPIYAFGYDWHHRLVVVEGKTELVLLDTAGKPVSDKRCRVVIDGRTRQGLTDSDGSWVVHHLRNAEVCGVEFPGLDAGAWDLQEKDGGAT